MKAQGKALRATRAGTARRVVRRPGSQTIHPQKPCKGETKSLRYATTVRLQPPPRAQSPACRLAPFRHSLPARPRPSHPHPHRLAPPARPPWPHLALSRHVHQARRRSPRCLQHQSAHLGAHSHRHTKRPESPSSTSSRLYLSNCLHSLTTTIDIARRHCINAFPHRIATRRQFAIDLPTWRDFLGAWKSFVQVGRGGARSPISIRTQSSSVSRSLAGW
jgi:hypothetical protein